MSDSHAILTWNEKKGFELHLDVVTADATVRFVGMPVAADGTTSMSAAPISLHNLDLLFKAHVDWRGNPCQIQEGSVQLFMADNGDDQLGLTALIEDPDSGQSNKVEVKLAVEVPPEAPDAGGPVPKALEEDELDWDDETTMERMFGDLPAGMMSGQAKGADDASDEVDDPRQVKGLAALFQALAAPEMDDKTGEVPIGTTGPPPKIASFVDAPTPEVAPAAPVRPTPVEVPPPPPAPPLEKTLEAMDSGGAIFTIEQEARSFLVLLVDNEHLELVDGYGIDALVQGVAPILASRREADAKAAQLSNWILDQESVEELYIDDESLASLLEQW